MQEQVLTQRRGAHERKGEEVCSVGCSEGQPRECVSHREWVLGLQGGQRDRKKRGPAGWHMRLVHPLKDSVEQLGEVEAISSQGVARLFDLPCSFECGPRVEQGNPVEDAKRVGP